MNVLCKKYQEGETIELPCKVVDMQGKPMKGITLSLIISDSLYVLSKPRVEQQKVTDSKGELTFTYAYSGLKFRFIRGEPQGSLQPVEIFETPMFSKGLGDPIPTSIFQYDSLIPIKIRFRGAQPLMKNGTVELSMSMHRVGSSASRLLDTQFAISSNRIDTFFKVDAFSQPDFYISTSLKLRDTTLWKGIDMRKGSKRDTVFTFTF